MGSEMCIRDRASRLWASAVVFRNALYILGGGQVVMPRRLWNVLVRARATRRSEAACPTQGHLQNRIVEITILTVGHANTSQR